MDLLKWMARHRYIKQVAMLLKREEHHPRGAGINEIRLSLTTTAILSFFPVGADPVSDRGGGHGWSSPAFLRPELCPGLCLECHLEMCVWAHARAYELISRENARGVWWGTLDMQATVLASKHRWFWNVILWCETGSWDLYVRGAEVRKLKKKKHTTPPWNLQIPESSEIHSPA